MLFGAITEHKSLREFCVTLSGIVVLCGGCGAIGVALSICYHIVCVFLLGLLISRFGVRSPDGPPMISASYTPAIKLHAEFAASLLHSEKIIRHPILYYCTVRQFYLMPY